MYLNVNFQRNKRICIYLFILTIIGCVIPAQAVPEGWSDPVPIPSYSSIAVDSQGKWHALYTTREQTSDMDYIVRLWYRNATGYNEELDSLTSYSDHFSPFNNLEIDIDQYGGVHVFYFDDISDTSLYTKYYRKPVVLVHGWHGNSYVWSHLISKLDEENIPVWDFDYSKNSIEDPRIIAKDLETYIKNKRAETGYTGDIDIVCHSMGAMVSRYYFERINTSETVNQWIGIAPVNHGAALADLRDEPVTWFVRLLKLIWPFDPLPNPDEPAIIQMNTDSKTVNELEGSLRSDIKYRVIAGYNPTHSWGFSKFFGLTREKWNGNYYSTYNGDNTVATEQSILLGRDYDVYPLNGDLQGYAPDSYSHSNLPKNPLVVDRVMEYLKNPETPSSQYRPPAEHLPDKDYNIEEQRNHGYITYDGELQSFNYQLANPSSVYLTSTWEGSSLLLRVISPSGQVLQPNVYPVVSYSNGSTYEQYGIDAKETGIWNVSIIGIDVPVSGEQYNITFSTITENINKITVMKPNGGETFYLGSILPLSWTYTGSPGTTVDIEVLKGGAPLKTLTGIPLGSGGIGRYNVTIPGSTPLGGNYRIRVKSASNTLYTDTSDGDFTISGPTISITEPNGGESYAIGSTLPMRWAYYGNPGTTVNIEVLKGTATLKTLAGIPIGSGGAGSYSVTIPASTPLGADYKIRISSTSNAIYTDTSDAPFKIIANTSSSITVTTPNGGENWVQGSAQTLRWNYTGNPGTMVKIEALRGNSVLAVIAPSTPIGSGGSGSYDLMFPFNTPLGSDYRIRVTSVSNPAWTDTSDDNFTISPAIHVTTPDGGENYPLGSTLPMSWDYTGNPGTMVNIDVFKGTTIMKTLSGIPIGPGGSGSYNVPIPASTPLGSDYTIRVTSVSYAACTDTSDGAFSISAA